MLGKFNIPVLMEMGEIRKRIKKGKLPPTTLDIWNSQASAPFP